MPPIAAPFLRLSVAVVVTLLAGLSGISSAYAQAQSCGQITAILRGIERNQAFASYNGIVQELQRLEQDVQRAEQQWRGSGCQQLLNSGQALSGQCQSIARSITLGRDQVAQLRSMAQEGQNLASNHQALMADYQRYNCAAGDPRGSLLDDMFGGQGGVVNAPTDPWSSQQTRRTVCVRTCDGFYWPISFSTTDSYVAQDAIKCHEMCPGTEVALFSYRNPGEEPEDMISLSGQPYRSMPYAFRFREEVDMSCSCKTQQPVGITALDESSDRPAGETVAELSIPLPQRDPRGVTPTVVAEAIYVPLPRPRPNPDGTPVAATGGAEVDDGEDMRIVEFGEREVRIVGPETPYVPEEAEEP